MLRLIKSFVPPDIASIVFEYAETVILACVRESDEQFDVCYYRPSQQQWFKDVRYAVPIKHHFRRKYIYPVDLVRGQPITCQNIWSNVKFTLPMSPVTSSTARLMFLKSTTVLLSPSTHCIYKLNKGKMGNMR